MSTFVDKTAGAVEHCETMAKANPDLAEKYYDQIAGFVKQKLWHQLTVTILDFLSDASNVRSTEDGTNSFLAVYDKVVLSVDTKLHPLSVARMAVLVAFSLSPDLHSAKAILENLMEKKDAMGVEATIFLQSKHAMLTLQTLLASGADTSSEEAKAQLAAIYQTMQKNALVVEEISSASVVTTAAAATGAAGGGASSSSSTTDQALVHAAHYQCAMTYYRLQGPPEDFYEQCIHFLTYSPPPPLTEGTGAPVVVSTATAPAVDYRQLAVDLCLAALTGDGVYNLGQVEQQQTVLSLLENTQHAWLKELLHAVAAGDVTEFQRITAAHAVDIQRQPALVHRAAAVQEKLTLLALVQLVVLSQGDQGDATHNQRRVLTLEEIAAHCQCPLEQVEWVVMRAFSVKLMEGSIDQVAGTVEITWVMPRILNAKELAVLADKFADWSVKVRTTAQYMQEQTATMV
jgi:26S proteasome regulatory subunit N9